MRIVLSCSYTHHTICSRIDDLWILYSHVGINFFFTIICPHNVACPVGTGVLNSRLPDKLYTSGVLNTTWIQAFTRSHTACTSMYVHMHVHTRVYTRAHHRSIVTSKLTNIHTYLCVCMDRLTLHFTTDVDAIN